MEYVGIDVHNIPAGLRAQRPKTAFTNRRPVIDMTQRPLLDQAPVQYRNTPPPGVSVTAVPPWGGRRWAASLVVRFFSLIEPYPPRLHYPQVTVGTGQWNRASRRQGACEESVAQCSERDQHGLRRHTGGDAQENDATVALWRVQQRVSEFGVHRHEAALLPDAAVDHILVRRPLEPLIGHRDHIKAGLEQHPGRRGTEILVELELHAGLVSGISTYRSRLISDP